jgi:uncharacterized protein (DUF433 family)
MTTTVAPISHIVLDDRGVARIAGSRSRVIDVVLDKQAYGLSPEQTHEQHPHLSLAQIHAALAYYYDHKAQMDAEIERRFKEVQAMREAAGESAFAKRMRAAGNLP